MANEDRFSAVIARLIKVRKEAQEKKPAAQAEFDQPATRMKGLFDLGNCNQVIEAVEWVSAEEFGTTELESVTFASLLKGENPDATIATLEEWATAAEQTLARTYADSQRGLSEQRSDPLF